MELPNYIGFRLESDDKALSVSIVPVDVSRLVFCRECKYYRESKYFAPIRFCYRLGESGINMDEGDFCSVGERKRPADA